MTEDLLIIAEEKSKVRSWMDSILFIIQGIFAEIIWNYRCEKINKWEKENGITAKEKRSKFQKNKLEVRTRTMEEKKLLLIEKKKERDRKKG